MNISLLKVLELLANNNLDESLSLLRESSTFKHLVDVKNKIKQPNDVLKFIDANEKKIENIEKKPNKKISGLFSSCVLKLKYCVKQGTLFIKKHWGKITFLICIIELGIFSYDQFKDKTSLIRKWFDKKNGIKNVNDDVTNDVIKHISSTTSKILNFNGNKTYVNKSIAGGRKFDIGVSSSDDYLKQFYGSNSNNIEKTAISKRLKTKDIPKGAKLYNTTFGTDQHYSGSFLPNRPDPVKNIKANGGRPHAVWSNNKNDVFISPGHTTYGSIDHLVSHELGHIYNVAADKGAIGKPDVLQNTPIGYHLANNNELGAALSDIRRHAYRSSNGRVDTANPEDFKKVISNPKKYLPSDLYDVVDEINNLQNYKGTDKTIILRRDELKQKFNDPEFLGQFANTKKLNTHNKTA